MNVSNAHEFQDRLVRRPPPGPLITWRPVPEAWGQGEEADCDPWDNKEVLRQYRSSRVLNLAGGFYPSPEDVVQAVLELLQRIAQEPVGQGGPGAVSRGPLDGDRDFVQFVMYTTSELHGEIRYCSPLVHPWPGDDGPEAGAGQDWEDAVRQVCDTADELYVPGVGYRPANSNFGGLAAGEIQISKIRFAVRLARNPLGAAGWTDMRGSVDLEAVHKVLTTSKSLITVKNVDNLCLFRCVAVLLLRAMWDRERGEFAPQRAPGARGYVTVKLGDSAWKWVDTVFTQFLKTRKGARLGQPLALESLFHQAKRGKPVQTLVARWLASRVGWWLGSPGKPGLSEIMALEKFIQQPISVFDFDVGVKRQYKGSTEFDSPAPLYLLRSNEHLWAVTSVTGLLGRAHYCADCDVGYNAITDHRTCPLRCVCCQYSPKQNGGVPCATVLARQERGLARLPEGELKWCLDCHQSFDTAVCLKNHRTLAKGMKTTRCETRRSCGKKGCRTYNVAWYEETGGEHKCGDRWCENCKQVYQGEHRCFLAPLTLRKRHSKFIFFDFECEQKSRDGVHTITHVGATYWDDEGESVKIWEPAPDGDCSSVGPDFFKWLFAGKRHPRGFVAIAHNGQGYDYQFLLNYALANDLKVQSVTRTGGKLKSMVINNVKFVDSLSHLTMSLAAIPKTVGLKESVRKGHFPHRMNAPGSEVQNYVGPIPPRSEFFLDGLTRAGKEEFDEWYASWEGRSDWSFRDEMRAYLISDCVVLREGMKAYTDSFTFETELDAAGEEVHEVSPLSHVTIASVCNNIYRSCFMPEDTIPLLTVEESLFVRSGFFGGRTAVFQAHVKCKPGEKIQYDDVCSLYPSVNACVQPGQVYPVGIPRWIESPDSLDGLLGFAEVDVTPPPDLLYHPVLAGKKGGGRLNFDLSPKSHAVYATCELEVAVEMGYVITKIYRVLHFDSSSTDVFSGYVKQFMAKKDQAGAEGNAGARAVAKLCLNSLWGRMGMRTNQESSTFVTSIGDAIALCEEKEVMDIITRGGGGYLEVVHREKGGVEQPSDSTCVALAAWTTALARLVLYKQLRMLGARAIYCDTDSVVYISRPGDTDVARGKGLGEWESELEGGDYISEFAALGPKLYAYRTAKGKTAVRCKGFRRGALRTEAALCIDNFIRALGSVKRRTAHVDAVPLGADLGDGQYYGDIEDTMLVRTHDRQILSRKVSKKLRPTLESRGRLQDDETMRVLPFGST